jgi:hypothetical protein
MVRPRCKAGIFRSSMDDWKATIRHGISKPTALTGSALARRPKFTASAFHNLGAGTLPVGHSSADRMLFSEVVCTDVRSRVHSGQDGSSLGVIRTLTGRRVVRVPHNMSSWLRHRSGLRWPAGGALDRLMRAPAPGFLLPRAVTALFFSWWGGGLLTLVPRSSLRKDCP